MRQTLASTDNPRNLELAHRLHLASRDMREAKSYINELHNLVPCPLGERMGKVWSIETAVLISVIVVYARSFRKSRTGGKAAVKLDAVDLGLFDSRADLAEVHDAVLAARDEAVAHADWTRHRTGLVSRRGTTRRSSDIPYYSDGIKMPLLWALLEHVEAKTREMSSAIDKAYIPQVDEPPT